jgi:hypothetical protein
MSARRVLLVLKDSLPIVAGATLLSDLRATGRPQHWKPVVSVAAATQNVHHDPSPLLGGFFHITRRLGVHDPTLKGHFDFVCHSRSFLGIRGEAATDKHDYSLGSVYQGPAKDGCGASLHMIVQHGVGVKPAPAAQRTSELSDDNSQRASWFESCLSEVSAMVPPGATIAFPHASEWFPQKDTLAFRALELWRLQRAALAKFAKDHPSIRVVVVQRGSDARRQAELRARRHIWKECETLQSHLIGSPPQTQRIGRLLATSIRDQILSTIREEGTPGPPVETEESPTSTAPASSMAEGLASAAEAASAAHTRAQQAVHGINQAITDAFHAKVRADVAAGVTSLDDIAYTRWMGVARQGGESKNVARVEERSSLADTRVCLTGLVVHPELNGRVGYIAGEISHGRVPVKLDAAPCVQGPAVKLQFSVSSNGYVLPIIHSMPEASSGAASTPTVNVKLDQLVLESSRTEETGRCL